MDAVVERQAADTVLMIRPARFGANPETAATNAFQKALVGVDNVQQLALREFDLLVAMLRKVGVTVEVFEDTPEPWTPDAVFPGNWVSFHADGAVYLYPMQAQNRRWERRPDIIEALHKQRGYSVGRVEDISAAELEGRYLEGTGSLVLDRTHRVAYACLSARTDAKLLKEWGNRLDYEVIAFHAVDRDGKAIYHTNIMMCVAGQFAVICPNSIPNADERQRLVQRLEDTAHEIIPITPNQLGAFAGNMLELETRQGGTVLAMSARAARSLTLSQKDSISHHARIVSSPVNTIENCSGGSVRCMLAEVFLPRANHNGKAQ